MTYLHNSLNLISLRLEFFLRHFDWALHSGICQGVGLIVGSGGCLASLRWNWSWSYFSSRCTHALVQEFGPPFLEKGSPKSTGGVCTVCVQVRGKFGFKKFQLCSLKFRLNSRLLLLSGLICRRFLGLSHSKDKDDRIYRVIWCLLFSWTKLKVFFFFRPKPDWSQNISIPSGIDSWHNSSM